MLTFKINYIIGKQLIDELPVSWNKKNDYYDLCYSKNEIKYRFEVSCINRDYLHIQLRVKKDFDFKLNLSKVQSKFIKMHLNSILREYLIFMIVVKK